MLDEITDLFEVLPQVLIEPFGRSVSYRRNVGGILGFSLIAALGGQHFFAPILEGLVIETAKGRPFVSAG